MTDVMTEPLPYRFGKPNGSGWIDGTALADPQNSLFQQLLQQIGATINTNNKRVIAASFALRYGWSSGAPLHYFMNHGTVMDLSLDNISLQFCRSGLYQHYSFHSADSLHKQDVINTQDETQITAMAEQLYSQATQIVEALHSWSRFSRRAIWAMIVSSWSSQCVRMAESIWKNRNAGYVMAEKMLQYRPELYRNKPIFYSLQYNTEQRLFQKRHACCLYYLGPDRSFCTSCPLIDDEERSARSYNYLKEYESNATSH